MVRARVNSFLCGFALAGGFAIVMLRQDVKRSHELLAEQGSGVEKRLRELEAATKQLQAK